MNIIDFKKEFGRSGQNYLGTLEQGEEDFPKLERIIRKMPPDAVVVFDIRGLDLFGYSYSKQTIRRLLQMAKANILEDRFFLVQCSNKKESEELSSALSQLKMAMICSTASELSDFYKRWFIAGELSEPYFKSLEYVIKKKVVTSGQMQRDLDLDSVQTASGRIKKLAEERLVRWRPAADRVRNVFDCERVDP